jgi:hypothetical protein
MAKIGRNDACPCESGKKFKKCCGHRAQVHPAHAMDRALVEQMLEFAEKRFPGFLPEHLEGMAEEQLAALVPLTLYNEKIEDRSVAQWFLDERGARLDAASRNLLEKVSQTAPSIWVLRKVDPGRGLHLENRLTGERCFVQEVSATSSAQVGLWIMGRVVDTGDGHVMIGMHSNPLLPRWGSRLEDELRATFEVAESDPMPADLLADDDFAWGLWEVWEEQVEEQSQSSSRMPTLQNTDGHVLVLCKDTFTSNGGCEALLQVLSEMPDTQVDQDDKDEIVLGIVRPGNAIHADWSNTRTGTVRIGTSAVVAETNSVERADALKAAMLEAAGAWLTYVGREATTPEALLKEGRKTPSRSADEIPPEVKAALTQQYKARHYATWADHPLPALDGLTPRQAMLRPDGRRQVTALLDEMAYMESRLPSAERYDVSELGRILGVEALRHQPVSVNR